MPLCGSNDNDDDDGDDGASQDPDIRQFEKTLAREAHDDQKTLQLAVKDLKNAEASHNKAIKAADKAHHTLEKAAKHENKTADALNKAHHQHEAALSNQSSVERTLELKQQHEQRLQQSLEQRKQAVENIQQRKQANDQRREAKLSDMHAHATRTPGPAVNEPPHPSGNANGNAPVGQLNATNEHDAGPGDNQV